PWKAPRRRRRGWGGGSAMGRSSGGGFPTSPRPGADGAAPSTGSRDAAIGSGLLGDAHDDLARGAGAAADVAHAPGDDRIAGREGPGGGDRQTILHRTVVIDERVASGAEVRARARLLRSGPTDGLTGAVIGSTAEIVDGVDHGRIIGEAQRIGCWDAP